MIIAIGGPSCSGKSTLANRLSEIVGFEVISMDNYRTSIIGTHVSPITGTEYIDWSSPYSFDVSTALLVSESYDNVIIEGLLALYFNEILQKADLKIYMDAPADLRLCRRMERSFNLGRASKSDTRRYHLESALIREIQFTEPTRGKADIVINTKNGVSECVIASFLSNHFVAL